MSLQPPVAPDATPAPQPLRPAFVASGLRLGKIGDGETLSLAMQFYDENGAPWPPTGPIIVLHQVLGQQLIDEFVATITECLPPEDDTPTPVVVCDQCGARIFNEVAEVGRCVTCQKATEAPGDG